MHANKVRRRSRGGFESPTLSKNLNLNFVAMNYANLAAALVRKTIKNGGVTLGFDGEEITTGFAVGGVMEFKFDEKNTRLEEITAALRKIQETGCYVGGWLNEGILYLDAVRTFKTEAEALKVGREAQEIAIFNLDTLTEIKC